MSLKFVVDMNLSPEWIAEFARHGWAAVHWSAVGRPNDNDLVIAQWAIDHAHVVFTHDLDFGASLAITHAIGPSVVQIRAQRVLPEHIGPLVMSAIRQYESDLLQGALVVIHENKLRVRVLPF